MTLEALSTRRSTFTWETSLTLWQRHEGAIRERDRVEAQGKAGRWAAERGAQDSGWLYSWEALAELHGERAGPRRPPGMADRTLTLGPTRPGAPASPGTPWRTRRMCERLKAVVPKPWLSNPPRPPIVI